MPERTYTYAEMRDMQQDAIRRVTEMQRVANERLRRNSAGEHAENHAEPPDSQNAGGGNGPPSQQNSRQTGAGSGSTHQGQQNRPNQNHPGQGHSGQNRPNQNHSQHGHEAEPPHHHHPEPPPAPQEPGGILGLPFTSGALEGIISKLGLETDQLIIIGLLLMLINEGADTTLLMALFYILI